MSTTLHLSTTSLCLPDSESFSPGLVLKGRYQVGRLLGQGGMAQVYEAMDLALHRPCVIKVPMGGRDPGRLDREFIIASALRKVPGVCQVLDRGRLADGETPYVVFERLYGETLSEYLDREGRLP